MCVMSVRVSPVCKRIRSVNENKCSYYHDCRHSSVIALVCVMCGFGIMHWSDDRLAPPVPLALSFSSPKKLSPVILSSTAPRKILGETVLDKKN